MRTSRRNPVLLIPGKGETKQQALEKLLDYWKQKDRRHGNRPVSYTHLTLPTN